MSSDSQQSGLVENKGGRRSAVNRDDHRRQPPLIGIKRGREKVEKVQRRRRGGSERTEAVNRETEESVRGD